MIAKNTFAFAGVQMLMSMICVVIERYFNEERICDNGPAINKLRTMFDTNRVIVKVLNVCVRLCNCDYIVALSCLGMSLRLSWNYGCIKFPFLSANK